MRNELITSLLLVVLFGSILGTPAFASKASEHYRVGYDDACAGRVVPGPHTSDYERGYAQGQAVCKGGNGSSDGLSTNSISTSKSESNPNIIINNNR